MEKYILGENQKRYFKLYQSKWPFIANNANAVIHYKGFFDNDLFQESLKIFQDNHSILRSNFDRSSNGCFVVKQRSNVPLNQLDYYNTDHSEYRNLLQETLNQNHLKVFDVGNWPLYQVDVIKKNDREGALILNFNHCIADAYSFFNLARQMLLIYEKIKTGNKKKLNFISYQPDHDALSEKCRLLESSYNLKTDIWKLMFSTEENKLNKIRNIRIFNLERTRFVIDRRVVLRLNALATSLNTSIVFILFFIYVKALIFHDDTKTIAIKEITSGRNVNNISHFNCLINLLPIIVPVDIFLDKTIKESINLFLKIRGQALSAQLPYWHLTKIIAEDLYLHPYGICADEFNFIPSASTSYKGGEYLQFMCDFELTPLSSLATFDRCLNASIGYSGNLYLEFLYNTSSVTENNAKSLIKNIELDLERL